MKLILLRLLNQTFPFFLSITWANPKIKKDIEEFENSHFEYNESAQDRQSEIIETLESILEKERNRKEQIEDKIKSLLFIITVSVLLMTGIISAFVARDNVEPLSGYALTFLLIGLLYFVSAGLSIINGLAPKPFSDIFLSTLFTQRKKNLTYNHRKKSDQIEYLYSAIKINQWVTMIRTNYTFAAFIDIRNGILFIFLFFLSSILPFDEIIELLKQVISNSA